MNVGFESTLIVMKHRVLVRAESRVQFMLERLRDVLGQNTYAFVRQCLCANVDRIAGVVQRPRRVSEPLLAGGELDRVAPWCVLPENSIDNRQHDGHFVTQVKFISVHDDASSISKRLGSDEW